ncbi:PepSY domain-containing protein [Cohnella soli]|uniref:PepSY domain-containing protein n=1 Tax=Cohnella soli TaxID=425005 RepID=A0ABW0HYI0_9BACL
MNKKLMVGVLAVALVGGGIAGAALLPSTNAATADPANSTSPVQKDQIQQDNDKEVKDDGAQNEQDNDKEVNDDGVQNKQDNDKEVNDDGAQNEQDNDKEVNDDGAQSTAITKQQSIDIAVKQSPGVVKSVVLESENGVSAYTVTIKDTAGKEHEVTVNATTGEVVPEND